MNGLLVYDNSDAADNLTDATFDNFIAHDIEPPRLDLTGPDSFGDIILSWPASYLTAGFKLQWASSPSAMNWEEIPNESIFINPSSLETATYFPPEHGSEQKFYRLRRP